MPWLYRSLALLCLFLAFYLLFTEAIIPVYAFERPRPFHGRTWYNPFEAETLLWSRANFHIHSRTWGGLTNGYNTPAQIQAAYQKHDIHWIGISDYQRINPESPIPLYEHGWNIGKVHQLCFWPEKVRWFDIPHGQSIHQKQLILAFLRESCPFVVIAHPRFMHSYTGEELARLGGYDAIEVLNRYGDSVAEWDSALSSGHYAPILAHDNVHNVENPHELLSRWTEIAISPTASVETLKSALTAGKTVGYKNRTPTPITRPYPQFARIQIRGDTLWVKLTQPADSLRVIGQGGTVRAVRYHTDTLRYVASFQDTYLRLEAYTPEIEAYTSPIVRGEPTRRFLPVPKLPHTFFKVIGMTLLCSVLAFIGGGLLGRYT